jgi:hypothetical protein
MVGISSGIFAGFFGLDQSATGSLVTAAIASGVSHWLFQPGGGGAM